MKKVNEKLVSAIRKIFSQPVEDKITISYLVQCAKINRTTFYRNFGSVEECLRWFTLKDLIFKYQGSKPFNFEYAFIKTFNYIDLNYYVLRHIFNSPYGHDLFKFVQSEVLAYQLMTFPKIDEKEVLSREEMQVQARFYSIGIVQLLVDYILDEKIKENRRFYILYILRVVKEYMERAIHRTKIKLYEDLV